MEPEAGNIKSNDESERAKERRGRICYFPSSAGLMQVKQLLNATAYVRTTTVQCDTRKAFGALGRALPALSCVLGLFTVQGLEIQTKSHLLVRMHMWCLKRIS